MKAYLFFGLVSVAFAYPQPVSPPYEEPQPPPPQLPPPEQNVRGPAPPPPPPLTLIATIDGKSIYADISVPRTWLEASAFCASLGLQLACITSPAQYAALNAAMATPDLLAGLYYWLSGRDAHLPREFSWDDTGLEISASIFPFQQILMDFGACLYLYAFENAAAFVAFGTCTTMARGTLCESPPTPPSP